MNMLHGTPIVEKEEIGKAMEAAAEYTTAIRSSPRRWEEGQNCRPVEFSILGGGVTCPTGVTNIDDQGV